MRCSESGRVLANNPQLFANVWAATHPDLIRGYRYSKQGADIAAPYSRPRSARIESGSEPSSPSSSATLSASTRIERVSLVSAAAKASKIVAAAPLLRFTLVSWIESQSSRNGESVPDLRPPSKLARPLARPVSPLLAAEHPSSRPGRRSHPE